MKYPIFEISKRQLEILDWTFDHWEELCEDELYLEDNPEWANVKPEMFKIYEEKGKIFLAYDISNEAMKERLLFDLGRYDDITEDNDTQGKILGAKSAINSLIKRLYGE